jgi:maleylacetoacetate isomerase
MPKPILYDYWRSSAAYRIRIGLNLKGVEYQSRQVDLRDDQQKSAEYRALNPQGLVPMLEIDGLKLSQSMAILTYLDLKYPNQPLIPASADARAHVIALCQLVVADIHPLNNLRVLKYLKNELRQPQEAIDAWYRHWILEGLPALEAMAKPGAGKFLFGNGPSAADVCLIPQLYNARRYDVPLDAFPTLLRAEENAKKLEAFAAAAPERQEVSA